MKRISSLELAIENEKREMEFYLNEADRSLNPMAKYLFETLASDEQDHIDLLRKLYNSLVEENKWPEEVSEQVADNNVLAALRNNVTRQSSMHWFQQPGPLNKGCNPEAYLWKHSRRRPLAPGQE